MAEDELNEDQTDEVADDATETEETEETEEQETEQVSDRGGELKARFKEAFPALASAADDMSLEGMMGYLLEQRAAEGTAKRATGDKEPVDDAKPGQPSAPEIPDVDLDRLSRDCAKSILDGDADDAASAIKALLKPVMDYATAMGLNALGAVKDYDQRIQTISKTVKTMTLADELVQSLSKVKGATEADVSLAKNLIESGRAVNATDALVLAAAQRGSLAVSAPKRSASEDARRKAQALAADKQGNRRRRSGEPVDDTIPGSIEAIYRLAAKG